ncbi:MAG: Lon family ATP-dependent protease [Candidatus Eremiobacteraeota bacterium]|nr:Lon family ATP-dependent protease [Candidatus Eremiobacteraeota bacterium]MBV8356189.1 Lon family ATP-dependent protease [Candidatus Eremiobacteraeota bacterium]
MAASQDNPYVRRFRRKYGGEEEVRRHLDALYDVLAGALGAEKIVLRAGKVGALKGMRSDRLGDRILALQRLVFEDPTIGGAPAPAQYRQRLEEIEEGLAGLIAQQTVEDNLDRKISAKMVSHHNDYLRELKLEALRDDLGPETPATQRKLEELTALDERRLSDSALMQLRPRSLDEVVGQEGAIQSLLAKIASPFPQHVILYGPPGVGKTTVARLVLEEAKKQGRGQFAGGAPFIEANGSTLRWDPRETTNPLLGSVHDPIYQGSRKEFAEGGIPEPKLGLVTRAHGGVLFIDEIGEMDPLLQSKLLKVLEDKRVTFESSYYDESDPSVPAYVKKLFHEGAPADFVLIGATTRDPEEIDPALRSRTGAVHFEPLTEYQVRSIVTAAAKRLGARCSRSVAQLIASYTIEGRKAVQILADAYGLALLRTPPGTKRPTIAADDVLAVVQAGRMIPHTPVRARRTREIGKTFGLGVLHYLGSLIEIEAIVFPAAHVQKGSVRFNETAGTMAKDSVFNAAAVLRTLAGVDLADYDLHVNVIGGGEIDGPSAGLAIFLATYSALTKTPLQQNVAVTGEISIQGRVRPVGSVIEKLYAARQAGMRAIVIPKENARELDRTTLGLDVIPVATVEEALAAYGLTPPRRPVARVRRRIRRTGSG